MPSTSSQNDGGHRPLLDHGEVFQELIDQVVESGLSALNLQPIARHRCRWGESEGGGPLAPYGRGVADLRPFRQRQVDRGDEDRRITR